MTDKQKCLENKKESRRAHVRDVSVCGDAEENIIRWQDQWWSGEGVHQDQAGPHTVQKMTDALIGEHVQMLQGLHPTTWRPYWATFVH